MRLDRLSPLIDKDKIRLKPIYLHFNCKKYNLPVSDPFTKIKTCQAKRLFVIFIMIPYKLIMIPD